MNRAAFIAPAFLAATLAWPGKSPHANVDQLAELKRLSVDELLDVEVTSVSRREEDLRKAAAAVAVITREDLRRSGANSMPEALRLVPGLHVARQNSTSWSVNARGFSGVNSEKLLVLSDTRSIYTPLFSGVAWDVQDYLLADVERVEVIRGPGAALWGSNAVNGVVNITTRNARDTHGNYLEAGAGNLDRFWAGARHGGQTAGDKHYRVFARFHDRAATENPLTASEDEARLGHLGFRVDWDDVREASWTVQGDAYAGDMGQLAPTVEVIGRPGPTGQLAGRLTANRNQSRGIFAVLPEKSDDLLWSGFVQDQISWTDSVALTLGTKLEHNDFSGFELQPSVRIAWTPGERHTLWATVSRAVRVPTRLERDINIDASDPAGNPVFRNWARRSSTARDESSSPC